MPIADIVKAASKALGIELAVIGEKLGAVAARDRQERKYLIYGKVTGRTYQASRVIRQVVPGKECYVEDGAEPGYNAEAIQIDFWLPL